MRDRMGSQGFSLIESVIAMVMVSVVFLSIIALYDQISRGILKSKYRTIATSLAQEQLEALKNTSYFRVVVSTCTSNLLSDNTPDSNSSTLGWPNVPERGLTIGGLLFNRYTIVEKMTENAGALLVVDPDQSDTGLKQVTIVVKRVDSDGTENRVAEVRSFVGDPDRSPLGGTLTGLVSSSGGWGVTAGPIASAKVECVENLTWFANTASNGSYTMKVATTNVALTFQASQTRHRLSTSGAYTFASGQTKGWSPTLTPIPTGEVTGYVVLTSTVTGHDFAPANPGNNPPLMSQLRISEVCPGGYNGTANEAHEFVELYNPTQYPLVLTEANFQLRIVPDTGISFSVPLSWVSPGSVTVPAFGYVLLAGSAPGMAPWPLTPDATYPATNSGTDSMASYNVAAGTPTYQGVGIGDVSAGGGVYVAIDSVVWCNNNNPAVSWGENNAIVAPVGQGLQLGDSLERMARYSSSSNSMAPGGEDRLLGNAFDVYLDTGAQVADASIGDNANNFQYMSPAMGRPPFPQNTASAVEYPKLGVALVNGSDPISQSTQSWSTPILPSGQYWGYYRLTDVATMTANGLAGSWTVQATSRVAVGTQSWATLALYGTTTPVTFPTSFIRSGANIYLATSPVSGGITGSVVVSTGGPPGLPLKVVASGGYTTRLDGLGNFLVAVPTGPFAVSVNKGNEYVGYTEVVSSSFTVNEGDIYNISPALEVHPAGAFNGKVTSDASFINPIPNVTVKATASGPAGKTFTAVTDDTGMYTIKNLAYQEAVVMRNPYALELVMDQNDASYPSVRSTSVVVGQTTQGLNFQLVRGWGKINGTVSYNGKPVTTGVLIVATTGSAVIDPSNPPTIDTGFRNAPEGKYGTVSLSDSTYEITARFYATAPYYTYYVYAWLSVVSGETVVTYKASKTVTLNSTSVNLNIVDSDWSPM